MLHYKYDLKKDLNKNGFCFIKNLIDESSINKIKQYVIENSSNKMQTFTIALFDKKSGQLDIKHKKSMELIKKIENIKYLSSNMKLVGNTASINRIDAYTSEICSNPILPWHNDRAFSGDKVIHNKVQNKLFSYKAFVYLTNSSISNGSLAFLPESHIISSSLRSLMRKDVISYEPFWSIGDFLKIVKRTNVINNLLNLGRFSKTMLYKFINNVEFILMNPSTTKFDLPGREGDCVLFDERGFHRGGIPSDTKRIILRLFYLNGSGKYEDEPITEYGKKMKNSFLGEFKSIY
tara:strand:+ start:13231 stop:14106 length:876 start_codon:yes stop_codon:yes gene_type:complete